MKVLAAIIIPPHLSASGAVTAAIHLSTHLADYCQIDIALMADRNAEEKVGNASLFKRNARNPLWFTKRVLPDKFRTLFYTSDIPQMIAQGDYELVHIHNPIPALEMKRIAAACLKRKLPYIVSTHGFVEITALEQAYRLNPLERIAGQLWLHQPFHYVVDHADLLFGLSPADLPLLHSLGVPESKIALVPNGVDELYYQQPTEAAIRRICHKFALPYPKPPNIPVCCFLGNHTRNKGLDILVEAFQQTAQPYLLLVGGKKRDYPYEQFAAQCGPQQRMVFTDRLDEQEILGLFCYADLFVFPSLADTLPLVILEAMATGLPVLSTTVGGIPHQVSSACGLLVPPGDALAFRNGFEQLVQNPEQLKSMGVNAQQRVKELFDWQQSATIAYKHYEQLLGQTTSKAHPSFTPQESLSKPALPVPH